MKINKFALNYLRMLLDRASERNLQNGTVYEEFWEYLTSVFCDAGNCDNKCDTCILKLISNVLNPLSHSDRKLRFYNTFIDLLEEKYYVPESEYRFEEEKNPQIYAQEAMEIASDMYDDVFEGGDE